MPDHEPTNAELAAIESELPEWDRLAVQDYWATVVAEELEAAQPTTTSYRWNAMGPAERRREHRVRRRVGNTVLRSIVSSVETSSLDAGEVAA